MEAEGPGLTSLPASLPGQILAVVPPLPGAEWLDFTAHRLLSWGGALLVAAILLARRRPWHQALGIALMATPLMFTFWNIIDSLEVLRDPNSRLFPHSRYALSRIYAYKLLRDVGYVGAGFLLYASGGRLANLARATPRVIAARLAAAGFPTGNRSETDSLRAGLLLLPVFLLTAWAVNVLLYSSAALANGDEASVWDNMTPYAAIMLSLAAGFGEEIVYRGVLQTGLIRVLPAGRGSLVAAILLQAVFFGFAHGGYGTWAHVLAPAMFGVVAGVMAARWGIWSAIALHVGVDIIAFSAYTRFEFPWFAALVATALLANLVWSLVWGVLWVARWIGARRPGAAV